MDGKDKIGIPVLCGAVLALMVSMIFFSSFFRVHMVMANTNTFTSVDELAKTAGVTYDRTPMILLSEKRLEKKLMKHPYVKAVKAHKQWPDKIKLEITYREDSFAIANAGFFIILDDSLQVLRVDSMAYDTVLLEGITFKEFSIGQKLEADQSSVLDRMVDLKQLMFESHINFEKKMVYEDNHIKVLCKNGISGDFGDGKNVEQRFNHFAEIYDNILSRGIQSGLIDVSNDGLPTYKPFGN